MTYELKDVLISVKDVSLRFGDKQILKPISLEVKDIVCPDETRGQVVGILGPSGIGKTQFSLILAGLQSPTTGDVFVGNGENAKKVGAGLVGMVAQNYPLFRHRTVQGNLLVALEKSGLSKKDKLNKVKEYLETFELSDKASLYPCQLSGGQRQRVSIIQELLSSEHYIVMDEPFSGLDPIMKDKAIALIKKVANLDERNTLFVVAHDIGALVEISDTLWLFGRDRDEKGDIIPGARIKKEYNLIDLGLAWKSGISRTREFADFVVEVKDQFSSL